MRALGVLRAARLHLLLALEKVTAIPMQGATKVAGDVFLSSDGAGQTWLTWWELPGPSDGGAPAEQRLYAILLADSGLPAGPVESWLVSDRLEYEIAPTRYPTTGPLGTIYPISLSAASSDGGSQREVHLIHRQRDVLLPTEDIVFTTTQTSFPVAVAQLAEPRALIVGYSTYPAGRGRGYGEIRRYGCAEDAR